MEGNDKIEGRMIGVKGRGPRVGRTWRRAWRRKESKTDHGVRNEGVATDIQTARRLRTDGPVGGGGVVQEKFGAEVVANWSGGRCEAACRRGAEEDSCGPESQ